MPRLPDSCLQRWLSVTQPHQLIVALARLPCAFPLSKKEASQQDSKISSLQALGSGGPATRARNALTIYGMTKEPR